MDKADRLLWRSVDGAILIAVLGMVCLIALQVGSRFVDASIPWTEELSRFLFIWTIWLGLAASFRAGAHPSLDILSMAAPHRLRLFFRAVQVVATVLLFAAVSWHGLRLLRQQITFGEQSPILQVGMWAATLPLVLGAALSILGAVVDGLLGQREPDDLAIATDRAKEHEQ
jgi:TRAP-type C4-dicarboxylate transport system permease small subunit